MKKLILISCVLFLIFSCGSRIRTWTNGIIPYKFEEGISPTHKIIIRKAMDQWETSKVIKFIYIPDRKSNVYIISYFSKRGRPCWCESTVGMVEGVNYLNIYNCVKTYLILHELGHCLGLQHEHQRPDRDKFLIINWKNIEKDNKDQFKLLKSNDFAYPYDLFPYDYNSIMNYGNYACAINFTKKTIISTTPIEDRELSKIDIEKIIYLYGKKDEQK